MNLMRALSYRLPKGALDRPSVGIEALLNGFLRQSEITTPLGKSLCFALKRQPSVVSAVIILLYVCGPATILGRVAQAIVDSFKCFAGWAFAHVRKKVLKRVPSFTQGDAASSVSGISPVRGFPASISHSSPDHQYRIWFSTLGTTVKGMWSVFHVPIL